MIGVEKMKKKIKGTEHSNFIIDEQGVILSVNSLATQTLGYAEKELLGKNITCLLSSELVRNTVNSFSMQAIAKDQNCHLPKKMLHKDGNVLDVDIFSVPFRSKGKVYYDWSFALSAKKVAKKTRKASVTVMTRAGFLSKIKQAIHAHKQSNLAVLLVNLKGFYRFNEMMGHDRGDVILDAIADRLLSLVSSDDLVVRIDGAAFGIVLTNVQSVDLQAHQIITALELPLLIDDTEICLGSSIGASRYPEDATDAEKLMAFADIALARAKKAGVDNYMIFSAEMKQEMEERFVLENDLRRALIERQFFLEYQPQLDLKTGHLLGFEALIRWKHPKRGLIFPNFFIQAAEDTGLITPLFEYVLDAATKQIKRWNSLGLGKMTMAVNLSAAQFKDKNLQATIKKLIKKNKIAPSELELEITESLLMQHIEETSDLLEQLVKTGIHIALDDFGTGYSSLSYLNKLPIHKIKIDRSFIQVLCNDKSSSEIVRIIIDLAHALKLHVIAEGCETKKQLNRLQKLNCDSVQGFYIARALPTEQAEELIYKYNTKCKK